MGCNDQQDGIYGQIPHAIMNIRLVKHTAVFYTEAIIVMVCYWNIILMDYKN